METQSVNIGDFYQQLAMLTKAGLPLPASLEQIAAEVRGGELQRVLGELSRDTAQGRSFSDVLARHPQLFSPFHVRLIAAGETNGTLSEALFAAASFSYFNYYMTSQARQVFMYPLLTFFAAAGVFIFLSVSIIPGFSEMFNELLAGCPLPGLTVLVLRISAPMATYKIFVLAGYAIAMVFCIWLFCGGTTANRTLLRLMGRLPGAWRISQSVDSARFCSLLRVFLRQNVPTADALSATAGLMGDQHLAAALERVAQAHAEGQGLVAAMEREPALDVLITFAVRQAPEDELAEELGRLAELFEKRVLLSSRSAVAFWELLCLVLMTVTVGIVVISLFLPLITIMGKLGG